MKNYFASILLAFCFFSCEKESVSEVHKFEDPINGLPEFLLDSIGHTKSFYPFDTTYIKAANYTKEGFLEGLNEVYYPENLDNPEKPYVIIGGVKELYCDSKRRVLREKDGENEFIYKYDDKDRLLVIYKNYPTYKDSVIYKYDDTELPILYGLILKYTITENDFFKNPGTGKTEFVGYITHSYYKDPSAKKIKAWQTRPYNYGKIEMYPNSMYVRGARLSRRETHYSHYYDENDLIVRTESSYIGGASEEFFKYKKR